MNPRLCKTALVAAVGFFFLVVTLNDALLDYRGNYQLVRHIFGMDTLMTGEQHAWRALRAPGGAEDYWLYHLGYWTVILWNAITGALCFAGAWRLWSAGALPPPSSTGRRTSPCPVSLSTCCSGSWR